MSTRPMIGRSATAAVVAVVALILASCASLPDAALKGPSTGKPRPSGPGSVWTLGSGSPFGPGSLSGSGATVSPSARPTAAATPPQLPLGGTKLFPRYRLVGYSGGDASDAFGRLGIGDLDARIRELQRTAASYAQVGRQPLPVLELITVIVQAKPGPDGLYRSRIDDVQIGRYLAAARRHKALLLLNIQPGRADFLTEVEGLQRWLAEPDVGIALDPEWAVGKHQVPGRTYGRTTAKELNAVAAYLSAFTLAHRMPEKAMVVHQLAPRIIYRIQDVKPHDGVQIVLSVDGIGSPKAKVSTWTKLVKPLPPAIHPGFKLFFEEDREHGKLMTPAQVLALKPTPDYVLYE
jgi:hypothetical protein